MMILAKDATAAIRHTLDRMSRDTRGAVVDASFNETGLQVGAH